MRTLIVGLFAVIATTVFVWFCCGFISGFWNPMTWEPVGRFLFVAISLTFSIPAFFGACIAYEDHLTELRKGH